MDVLSQMFDNLLVLAAGVLWFLIGALVLEQIRRRNWSVVTILSIPYAAISYILFLGLHTILM